MALNCVFFNVNKHFLMYIKEEKDLFKGRDLKIKGGTCFSA